MCHFKAKYMLFYFTLKQAKIHTKNTALGGVGPIFKWLFTVRGTSVKRAELVRGCFIDSVEEAVLLPSSCWELAF